MDTATQPFDISRFAKLWALADTIPHGTDNSRERETARRMAMALARSHGMTLEQAVAMIRRSQGTPSHTARAHTFPLDSMEELILAAGLDPLAAKIDENLALYRILYRAIPFPKTIRTAVAEFEAWDALEANRTKIHPAYRLGRVAAIRREMIATFISDHRASGIGEAVARAAWVKAQLWRPGRFGFQEKRAVQTMAEDMARMADKIAGLAREAGERPPQPQPNTAPLRRTGAMKRADVLSILDEPGGDRLTFRHIAERAGVSPETVRRVKRERAKL